MGTHGSPGHINADNFASLNPDDARAESTLPNPMSFHSRGVCSILKTLWGCVLLQAQDRCHRIGQTREVHIYRLVSESTIEENILHKSDQKRQLDHLAIQSGGFNTDFLQKFNPRELLGIQGKSHLHCCLHRMHMPCQNPATHKGSSGKQCSYLVRATVCLVHAS